MVRRSCGSPIRFKDAWIKVLFVAGIALFTSALLLAGTVTIATSLDRHPVRGAAQSSSLLLLLPLVLLIVGVPLGLTAALWQERRKMATALQASNGQIQSLTSRLIAAQEQERALIARELHDEIGQSLTVVKINLDTVRLCDDPSALPTLLDESIAQVDLALEQVRNLAVLMRPSLLTDFGLGAALRQLTHSQAKCVGYHITLATVKLQPRPLPEIESICYRVAQEGLTNIARHAKARNVAVDLRIVGRHLRLIIRDDGLGFDADHARQRAERGESSGMVNMHDRARLGGGHLRIDSAQGRGTTLTLTMPSGK